MISSRLKKESAALGHRRVRIEREIGQRLAGEKLAEEADMHRTYLAGIERSLRNPSLENIGKLANALEKSRPESPSSQP